MKAYRTILFDLDGTLTDPGVGITKSVQYALRKLNIVENDFAKLRCFIGPPLQHSFERYYQLEPAVAWQAVQYYREYFAETGIFENTVYPGMIEGLSRLVAAGKCLAVATSKPTVYSEKILAHFKMDHFFHLIIGSNLDGTRVAKTEVIAAVMSNLPDFASQEPTVMVGDREHDIIGAKNNQIDAIGVLYGYGAQTELAAAQPDLIVASVTELFDSLLNGCATYNP